MEANALMSGLCHASVRILSFFFFYLSSSKMFSSALCVDMEVQMEKSDICE